MGVTVQGKVTINNGSGTLTLAGNASTKVGETKNLALTIDKKKSAVFALNITEGRTLNANEKEMVGEYFYSVNTGWYEQYAGSGYSGGIWTDLYSITSGSAVIRFYFFKADGTYEMIQGVSGNIIYTGRFEAKGKWAISTPGIIKMTDITESYTSNDTRWQSYTDRVMSDENNGYVKSTHDGKQGYYIVPDATPQEIQSGYVGTWQRFYVKYK